MGERHACQGKTLLVSFLLLVFENHVISHATYNSVNIDCGAQNGYKDSTGIQWRTDDGYAKSGQNKQVANNGLHVSEQMDNLRVFKYRKKNCYSIAIPDKVRYLIRTGFFYGNYDGLARPPAFDLVCDGNKWVKVVTFMDRPIFHEMIYAIPGNSIDICIARTSDDQIPFISSIEVVPLDATMYANMNRNYAWFMNYRDHFGGSDVIGYPDDHYNRNWNPISTPGSDSVVADDDEVTNICPDDPPPSVILHGSQSSDENTSILLLFDFPEIGRINYLALNFAELIQVSDVEKRSFSISIDGQDYGLTVTPQYKICEEVDVTTDPASGAMNITISPADDSTLPPLINAVEVFTVSPTIVLGTNQDDMSGLRTTMGRFSRLQAWTGNPCLPNNTVWEWVGCNADDPPRVISLHLSGYGLKGEIPDFSQMQALEIINMDHNQLTGKIPDFLGTLPNLKLLNLSYNNLDSQVPSSLTKSKIIYDLTNQGDNNPQPKKKKNQLKALWSLTGIPGIGFAVWWLWCCYGQ